MKYLGGLFLVVLLLASCATGWEGEERDFRQDMRDFVMGIHQYAETKKPGFIIIPQNGHELLTLVKGNPAGTAADTYIAAIDGVGREDLFYGYDGDDKPTAAEDTDAMVAYMDLAEGRGVEVLATDYCSTHTKMTDSYNKNAARGYISFAADSRELDTIPDFPSEPFGKNTANVTTLAEAKNFLYLINPSEYSTKTAFLQAAGGTDYDLVIMDLFDIAGEALTPTDLAAMRQKDGGGTRLLICYMSIGEAEDYRYYWQDSWNRDQPEWIAAENPAWKGNYKVEYWNTDWQAIIYGSTAAYLDRIIAAGFDGVYLDIIDAYEFFEEALGL
ncbi:MAG: endo alpha-1,4 polygalactosaminidase [Spirochaetales bacterium]|nr:endo alpha-1,4 polygalactosaminidase [Spirochaetales bacterium]